MNRVLSIGVLLSGVGACNPQFSGSTNDIEDQGPLNLTLGCWNLQWFGSPSEGPADDALQLATVRDLIRESDVDVWALVEIADTKQFQTLLSELPGYDGMLTDHGVPDAQELGLLYKTSAGSLLNAEPILSEYAYEFAGRPPLEARLEVEAHGSVEELVVIVLHAKAFDDLESWQRRQNASLALKQYMDASYSGEKVAVLGDFNDDVDASISTDQASPYANFVADRTHYAFPTAALSAAGKSSTLYEHEMIDHHLVSNELLASFIDGSAEVLDVEDYTANEAHAASDHHPVVTRYER